MAFQRFLKIRLGPADEVGPKHINAMQDNVETALTQLTQKDILDRTLVKRVALTPSGINYVAHTLGRPVQGYNVTARDSNFQVWNASGTNLAPARCLPLMSTATGFVNLEVF